MTQRKEEKIKNKMNENPKTEEENIHLTNTKERKNKNKI